MNYPTFYRTIQIDGLIVQHAFASRRGSAASYKAQAELLQAQSTHLPVRPELEQTIGRTPRQ